jgi:hypothetical protein
MSIQFIKTNGNPDCTLTLPTFASVAQDLFHYCLMCVPSLSSQESAFVGSGYDGLAGRLRAYGSAFDLVDNLANRGITELNLDPAVAVQPHRIESVEQLIEAVTLIFKALERVCRNNCVDAYSGCFVPASVPRVHLVRYHRNHASVVDRSTRPLKVKFASMARFGDNSKDPVNECLQWLLSNNYVASCCDNVFVPRL